MEQPPRRKRNRKRSAPAPTMAPTTAPTSPGAGLHLPQIDEALHALATPLRPSLLGYGVLVLLALALLLGLWGAWTVWTHRQSAAARAVTPQAAALQQQVVTLQRSDQISREANRSLQATLAARDEEIAALRAEVAFYEQFVGPEAQRRGLAVHALSLKPQDARTWHFTATLVQNVEREASTEGRATVMVEGTQNGKLVQLPWARLRQQTAAAGVPFAFRFFQRIEGDLLLPEGFKPVRVVVTLTPVAGRPVQTSFTWSEAIAVAMP